MLLTFVDMLALMAFAAWMFRLRSGLPFAVIILIQLTHILYFGETP